MKVGPYGQTLYVFKAHDDEWVNAIRELFMGPLGWEREDFDDSWVEVDTQRPSQLAQLLIVYRFQGLSPIQAIDVLVTHPDYDYMRRDWETSRADAVEFAESRKS